METVTINLELPKEVVKKMKHEAIDKDYESFDVFLKDIVETIVFKNNEKTIVQQFIEILPKLSKEDLKYAKSLLKNDAALNTLIKQLQNKFFNKLLETENEEPGSSFPDSLLIEENYLDKDSDIFNPDNSDDEINESSIKVTLLKNEPEKPLIVIPTSKDYKKLGFDPLESEASDVDDLGTMLIQEQENTEGGDEFQGIPNGYIGNKLFENERFDKIFSSEPFSSEDDLLNDQSARAIEIQLRNLGVFIKPKLGVTIDYDPSKTKTKTIVIGEYATAKRYRPLTNEEITERDKNSVYEKLI
jgi:hypothetical protein